MIASTIVVVDGARRMSGWDRRTASCAIASVPSTSVDLSVLGREAGLASDD